MSVEQMNAALAAELIGIVAILVPLLIVGIRDLLAMGERWCGVWSLLTFLEKWKDK